MHIQIFILPKSKSSNQVMLRSQILCAKFKSVCDLRKFALVRRHFMDSFQSSVFVKGIYI